MVYWPKIRDRVLELYVRGLSFRKIEELFQIDGICVDHNTIARWVKREELTFLRAHRDRFQRVKQELEAEVRMLAESVNL